MNKSKIRNGKFLFGSIFNVAFGKLFFYLRVFFKKYGLLGIVGLMVFAITTYPTVSDRMFSFSRHILFGKFYDDYQKIDQIKMHYQLDSVIDVFGNPSVINNLTGDLKENLFIQDSYILQIIVDQDKKIIGLGIVCLDKNFNYKIGGVRLCKSNFYEIDTYDFLFVEMDGYVGTKTMEYFETYGGDGVHGYINFSYGLNPLGYFPSTYDLFDFDYDSLSFNKMFEVDELEQKDYIKTDINIQKFRKNTLINTYFVSDRLLNSIVDADGRERFGPDFYQINYFTSIELF